MNKKSITPNIHKATKERKEKKKRSKVNFFAPSKLNICLS